MSLATAERLATPDYEEEDSLQQERARSAIPRLDLQRSVVTVDYGSFCDDISDSLRHIVTDENVVNSQFDLAVLGWLKEYFSRTQPEEELPSTLVFQCDKAPVTPWLGGFHCLRDRYIEMAGNSTGLYDVSEAPDLRFETYDQVPLVPIYPEASQQWWGRNGPVVA